VPRSLLDMIAPPVLERHAEVPAGMVFVYGGRPLMVVRVVGNDPAAPVICEELAEFGTTLRGQFSLWSLDGVRRALRK
jgi:hypothetical protein